MVNNIVVIINDMIIMIIVIIIDMIMIIIVMIIVIRLREQLETSQGEVQRLEQRASDLATQVA